MYNILATCSHVAYRCSVGDPLVTTDMGQNCVRLAGNRTNVGFFRSDFSTFWLVEPKCSEICTIWSAWAQIWQPCFPPLNVVESSLKWKGSRWFMLIRIHVHVCLVCWWLVRLRLYWVNNICKYYELWPFKDKVIIIKLIMWRISRIVPFGPALISLMFFYKYPHISITIIRTLRGL